jgi:ribonuclease HII
VILSPAHGIEGLRDSKQLSAKKREHLFEQIIYNALYYGIGRAEPHEIDTLNILQATLLAMQRAVAAIKLPLDQAKAWIDGLHCPKLSCETEAVVRGDEQMPLISAASILAKVTRDREMCHYETIYPGYGFAKHKGYPTREHCLAIKKLGYTSIHRRSFRLPP